MNTKKIGQFFKKYAFYIGVGVICVGALTAIYIMPKQDGNVKDQANPYAKNKEATGKVVGSQDDLDSIIGDYDEEADTAELPSNLGDGDQIVGEGTKKVEQPVVEKVKEPIAENFDSTTATALQEPFFAQGDTFLWPVKGQVIVPYTDENTKYWFSETLNQTMRTFGICIAAPEGEKVKAVADGKVIDILDDSSTLTSDIPYVGKTMIVDNGNGYTTVYGFQNGAPNKELLGKVVRAGDTLGTVGKPAGAFVTMGSNIYLQTLHNKEVINPLELLDYKQNAIHTEVEGVDMGHTDDSANAAQ